MSADIVTAGLFVPPAIGVVLLYVLYIIIVYIFRVRFSKPLRVSIT